jgi:2,3-bisphosphoglycerate-independent phosphoglycerate mutase
MKKIIFVLIDGGSDTPCKELNGLTPLDVAEKPNIDFLTRNGRNGIVYPFARDFAPESDVATIALLGFDPLKYHVGRGPFEALGAGIKISSGELALRCNFASVDKNNKILDVRGAGITIEEAEKITKEINEKVRLEGAEFLLKNTVGHRAVLILSKPNFSLSNEITNTHPGYNAEQVDLIWSREETRKFIFNEAQKVKTSKLLSCKPLTRTNEAKTTALLVNEFIKKSKEVMENSEVNKIRENNGKMKVNAILTRDAGNKTPILDSYKKRFNLDACCIADMPLEKGIGIAADMYAIELKERSDVIKSLEEKFKKIMEYYDSFNFFYIHIKGCDEASHRKNPFEKKKMIEMIDKYFFGNLLRYINTRETIICITCDHTTSSEFGVHTADPVPLTISGANIIKDNVQKFSEKNCIKGSLGSTIGKNLVPMLLSFLRR